MPEVRHSPLTWRLFDLGFSLFRSRHLLPTRFGGSWPTPRPGRAIVLVGNHISWWDGFLLREIQRHLRPGAPFHTVVVAEQLGRHPMLRRLGGVPVTPSAPSSVLAMLRTLGRLRARDPETVFGYFPQGRIWPSSRRPLSLRRGIEAVARIVAPAEIVPVSIHIEPLVSTRPTPFVWLGEPLAAEGDVTLATAAVEARLTDGLDRIRERLDEWGEDTVGRWVDATPATPGSRTSPVRGAGGPSALATDSP